MTLLHQDDYIVLLYHGVYADGLDLDGRNSSGKHISEGDFSRQMDILAREWNAVSMRDISLAHRGETPLPPRAVAVTFDDGFANVHDVAWPILRERDLPATFYLTTGFIDSGRGSWTDQLEIMILGCTARSLELETSGEKVVFGLDSLANRVKALKETKRRCKMLPFDQVRKVLAQMESLTGVTPRSPHPLYEMVSWDQARDMTEDPLIDIGAHTIDHIPLTRMPFEEMARQIRVSLQRVSEEIGGGKALFSYPEGQPGDFDEVSISFLKQIGLDFCPTAIDGVNNVSRTDPFLIHRYMVGFEGRPFVLQ